MKKVAYRLWADKTLREVNMSRVLFEVDEDYLSKSAYIEAAKKYTQQLNDEFDTDYTYEDIFGEPEDIGWRYCTKCDTFFWDGEDCECK